MRRRLQSTSAKINEVPDNLLEKILTCMPIHDAVKTSVLSRRWRNIWKNILKLTFDDSFCKRVIKSWKRKPVEVICQVLLLHDGPIHNFSLILSNMESCTEIDQFLLVVSKRDIKEFTLRFRKGETYRLPSSIFSCQHFEHLNLHTCSFRPPAGFKGFSKLVSLALSDVSIDGQLFSSLIHNCLLLESLTFETLTIYDRLELFAPNLKYLKIIGLCKFLCFGDTPKLTTVDLYMDVKITKANNKCLLSGRLPVLDKLELDNDYAEFMTVNHTPELLADYLCNLKTLCLWDMCFRTSDDVSSIVSLIHNSPKLEKLMIHAYIDHTRADLVSINEWNVILHQLKEVELLWVSGSKCEIQFIELLLANSPGLKKIVIQPELEEVVDKGLKFFKELSRFRRSSPLVEIVYKM